MAKNLALISREIFYFFSATLVVAIILELIWPNVILSYFNLNYLLLIWLLSALVVIFKK
ncbi:hypothetical protein GW920_02750 [Candidatus Falkowbacteria bacterium]|nr:hypothetical protein [Candidatus Falkowbacteria bacterium]NCQ12722.1 hypothetical protein [Candidatus Falkowbacteria bacterium]